MTPKRLGVEAVFVALVVAICFTDVDASAVQALIVQNIRNIEISLDARFMVLPLKRCM
jgi:hypothetical protein